MDLELAGKRAIVTGGSRGIGKAIVRQLAIEGVDVGIAARDEQRIGEATTELSALTGRRVVGRSCDTGDDESVRAMVAFLSDALGGVDILVNAAAMPGGVTAASEAGRRDDRRALGGGEREGDGLPPVRPRGRAADGRRRAGAASSM